MFTRTVGGVVSNIWSNSLWSVFLSSSRNVGLFCLPSISQPSNHHRRRITVPADSSSTARERFDASGSVYSTLERGNGGTAM